MGVGLVLFTAFGAQLGFSRHETHFWRSFLCAHSLLHLLLFIAISLSVYAVVTESEPYKPPDPPSTDGYTHHGNLNCYGSGHGAGQWQKEYGQNTGMKKCKEYCDAFPYGIGSDHCSLFAVGSNGQCFVKDGPIDTTKCGEGFDTYVREPTQAHAHKYAQSLNLAAEGAHVKLPRYPFCDMTFPLSKLDDSGADKSSNKFLDFFKMCSLSQFENSKDADRYKYAGIWLPGWTIRYKHDSRNVQSGGWTTFLVMDSPSNSTTVFAIRGTQSALDILQDLNIFSPVSITQIAGVFGPDLRLAVTKAVTFFNSVFPGGEKHNFKFLEEYAKNQMAREPTKRYYFTGHSLGGGLAKLLALELGTVAVAFSGPGLATTALDLLSSTAAAYDKTKFDSLAHAAEQLTYNVVPNNDLVPMVDRQLGSVFHIPCPRRTIDLRCHLQPVYWKALQDECYGLDLR